MRAERPVRAPRPLGLTLALVAMAALYGVVPLLEVYFLKRLDATADEAYLLGGVTITVWTWLQGAFGALVLVVCALAWWGRPPQIRFVLMALLLVLTAITLYRVVEAARTPADPIFGGQAQSALRGYLRCQLPGLIVAAVRAVYLNRAPARLHRRRPLLPGGLCRPGGEQP